MLLNILRISDSKIFLKRFFFHSHKPTESIKTLFLLKPVSHIDVIRRKLFEEGCLRANAKRLS